MVNPYSKNMQEYKRTLARSIRNGQSPPPPPPRAGSSGQKKNFTLRTIINKKSVVQGVIIFQTVGISAIVAFIVFFMTQVIWADWFASNLPPISTGDEAMYWVQILLMLGIITGLGLSIITSFLFGDEKKIAGETKSQRRHMLESIIISFALAFLTLVLISFIAVFAYDPYIFTSLTNPIEWLAVSFEVIADFVIYVFPRPTEFWLMSIGIFYGFLTMFFFVKVPRSRKLDARRMKERSEKLRQDIINRTKCNDGERKRKKMTRKARNAQRRAEEIRNKISTRVPEKISRKQMDTMNDIDSFLR